MLHATKKFLRLTLARSPRTLIFSQLVAVEVLWAVGLQLLFFVAIYFAVDLGSAGLVWIVPLLVSVGTFFIAGLYYALKAGSLLAKRPELADTMQHASAPEFRALLTSGMNVF